jgi:hypothetical protein
MTVIRHTKEVLMYRPDYDGISDIAETMIERDEAALVASLVEAMNDGEITTCTIPYAWEICGTCRGNGGHSRRLGVIHAETWGDWDDEEREAYLGGAYDARCERCNGSGKVREIAYERLPADVGEWIENYRRDSYQAAAEYRAERLAGC